MSWRNGDDDALVERPQGQSRHALSGQSADCAQPRIAMALAIGDPLDLDVLGRLDVDASTLPEPLRARHRRCSRSRSWRMGVKRHSSSRPFGTAKSAGSKDR